MLALCRDDGEQVLVTSFEYQIYRLKITVPVGCV